MKETLDDQSRAELVKYRISRADETIKEAMLLTNEGYYNAAINRLYYACFYAVQALLVKNGISSASHAGVKTMLSLNFVSKGLLDVEYGKTFSRLFIVEIMMILRIVTSRLPTNILPKPLILSTK